MNAGLALRCGLLLSTTVLSLSGQGSAADEFSQGVAFDWIDRRGARADLASRDLLKRTGVDSARIRVSGKGAEARRRALANASRAKALGLKVMIDFREADGIREILTALREKGIRPQWVTFDCGSCKAGYEASKSIFGDMRVVVRIDSSAGNRAPVQAKLKALAQSGAKWDVLGLTLCPCRERPPEIAQDPARIPDFDSRIIALGIANCSALTREWKCHAMIVETAFEAEPLPPMTGEYVRTMKERLLIEAREHTRARCLGVFYDEPFGVRDMGDAPSPGGLPTCGLCAHAGDTSSFPGNTAEAFASGLNKGAAMIEFDLKRCKSGEIVLNHDRTVNYNGTRTKVRDLTLAQLKQIDLRGCRIPTLQEGLAVIPRDGVWINVHCGDLPEDVSLAEDAMAYVKDDGRIRQAFLSAPTETIAAVRKRVPDVIGNSMSYPKGCWRHLWTRPEMSEFFEVAMRNGCRFVQCHMCMPSPSDTAKFRACGGRVNYYVCNTALRLEPLLERGVDFPLTDRLDEMCGRFRAVRRAWKSAPRADGALRLRLSRNEKADVAYSGTAEFGELRNADGVIFPKSAIGVRDGRLKVRVDRNIPAGIYRGRGLIVHVNDFALDDGVPAYVGATADRGNVEAYAKALEAAISKVDVRRYPNWNWVPAARAALGRVRAPEAKTFGFTDDPEEYDFWRNALADIMDGNCRY